MNKTLDTAVKATYFSIVSNIIMAAIKWTAGILGHSQALIADATESTTDIFASLVVLLGIKYSSKPADKNHPYGHGRIEPLITFIVVGLLGSSAFVIIVSSIYNMGRPHEMPHQYTLYILGVIILWKELSFQYIMRKAIQTNSSSLKAEAWHHRSDSITSVAAFLGIGFARLMGKGFESADDWAALVAAGFILYNSYKIFRPALGEMMDEHSYDTLVKEIRKTAKTVDLVIGTEKCLIRKTGMQYHVDLHVIVDGEMSVRSGHSIAHQVKHRLIDSIPEIVHVLVHVEPTEVHEHIF